MVDFRLPCLISEGYLQIGWFIVTVTYCNYWKLAINNGIRHLYTPFSDAVIMWSPTHGNFNLLLWMLLEKEPVVPVTHIDQVIPSLESSIKAPFPFESVISSHPENHVMSTGCQVLVASFKTASVVLGCLCQKCSTATVPSLVDHGSPFFLQTS